MATCSLGAVVKPGTDPTKWIPIDISLYSAISVVAPWWLAILGQLWIPTEMQVADICALNPDDPPLPSVGDIAKAIIGDPTSLRVINTWIKNKLTYLAFSLNCACATGTACIGSSLADGVWTGAGCFSPAESVGNNFLMDESANCPGVYYYAVGGAPNSGQCDLWDAGSGTLMDTCFVSGVPGGSHLYKAWDGGTHLLTGGHSYTVSIRKVATSCYPANFGAPAPTFSPYAHAVGNGVYNSTGWGFPSLTAGALTGIAPELCGTGTPVAPPVITDPPQPVTITLPGAPTCTTIQDVCNVLQQLILKLDFGMRNFPIPTITSSVAESTVHAGLTGTSSISVSGIVGFKLTLTTVPASYGTEVGNPPTKWGVARVAVLTAEGMRSQAWYGAQSEVMVGPDTTTLDYYFAPGVVATITELDRGP